MRPLRFLASALLASQGDPQQMKPPFDLFAVSTESRFVVLDDPAQDRHIEARIRVATASKTLSVSWWASAAEDAFVKNLIAKENVAYYPTAMGRSWDDLASFYVAGRIGNATHLERWTIEADYTLSVMTDAVTGLRRTVFVPPTITRTPIPLDSSIKNVCSLTVNPWPPGGGEEEVWLFEWETRDVWAIDQTTGANVLKVSSAHAAPYRSILMIQHSSFGAVCRFSRAPWGRQASLMEQNNDMDLLVSYDRNLDGQIDGIETITFDVQAAHPIYATGDLWVPWEDQL